MAKKTLLALATIVVFIAYAFFPWATLRYEQKQFNSPDEAANYYFAKRVSEGESVAEESLLAGVSGGVIHPRAMQVVNGKLVPGSFFGMPIIYGAIALAFGKWLLPYLTALATVLLLFMCFSIWKHLFDKQIAFLATVLMAIHPAVWYYASRGFFHNILFITIFCAAVLSYLKCRAENYDKLWLFISLIILSLSLFVRASEFLWILPIVIAFAIIDRQEWRSAHVVAALSALAVGTISWIWLSNFAYGQLMPPGYLSSTSSVSGQNFLWPFGINPGLIMINALQYGIWLFLPFWFFVTVGVYINYQTISKKYLIVAAWVTTWLLVYYGGIKVVDAVGAQTISLGVSYVRYWMPVYIIWIPFAAMGLIAIFDHFSIQRRAVTMTIILLLIGFISFWQVFFSAEDGLVAVALRLQEYRATSRVIEQFTNFDAIIIGDRADKATFPQRSVIVSDGRPVLTIPEIRKILPLLVEHASVYFNTVEKPDAAILESLAEERFQMISPMALPDRSWLYRLVRL